MCYLPSAKADIKGYLFICLLPKGNGKGYLFICLLPKGNIKGYLFICCCLKANGKGYRQYPLPFRFSRRIDGQAAILCRLALAAGLMDKPLSFAVWL